MELVAELWTLPDLHAPGPEAKRLPTEKVPEKTLEEPAQALGLMVSSGSGVEESNMARGCARTPLHLLEEDGLKFFLRKHAEKTKPSSVPRHQRRFQFVHVCSISGPPQRGGNSCVGFHDRHRVSGLGTKEEGALSGGGPPPRPAPCPRRTRWARWTWWNPSRSAAPSPTSWRLGG